MRLAAGLAFWLLATIGSSTLWASAGSFDPTFGTGGHVVTVLGNSAFAGRVVRQADGKLVVLGSFQNGSGLRHLALVRYGDDGTVDPTFGDDGTTDLDLGTYALERALVQMPDGRLLVVAYSFSAPSRFAIARLSADGALDATFDGDGVVEPVLAEAVDVFTAALQPDGMLLVGGDTSFGPSSSGGPDALVMRFDANGALDPAFGAGGIATVDFAGGRDDLTGLALEPGGRIVVAGFAWDDPVHLAAGSSLALARLEADGTRDTTFGAGGITLVANGQNDVPLALIRRADGRLLVAGSSQTHPPGQDSSVSSSQQYLLRLDANGGLDFSFGPGGIKWLDGRLGALGATLVEQADGKVVWVGSSFSAAFRTSIGIGRFEATGSPDGAFGDAGVVSALVDGADVTGLHGLVDPDGRIVVVGRVAEGCDDGDEYGECYRFAAARFLGAVAPCEIDADCPPCESCGPAGACVFGPRVCLELGLRAKLATDNPYEQPEKTGVRLKWTGDTPLGFDPATEAAGLCMYLANRRALALVAPAGGTCAGKPCWSSVPGARIRYRNKLGSADGVRKLTLTRRSATFQATGSPILRTMHGLPFPAVVEQHYGAARVQIHAGGVCLEASFPTVRSIFKRVEPNTYTWVGLRAAY
jgi:uncharacterized delta-60 repeat protein